jgi:hypothetical protein
VQIIQQSVLIKQKYFVRFLRQHGPDIYREVRAVCCVLCCAVLCCAVLCCVARCSQASPLRDRAC